MGTSASWDQKVLRDASLTAMTLSYCIYEIAPFLTALEFCLIRDENAGSSAELVMLMAQGG